jgi:ankyrin repeat protein
MTLWQISAHNGNVEILEKFWECANKLQLNPEELNNEVFLSKVCFNRTPLHVVADRCYVKILDKMWEWDKGLQLKAEELRKYVFLSKDYFNRTPWHIAAEEDKFEVLEKCESELKNCS